MVTGQPWSARGTPGFATKVDPVKLTCAARFLAPPMSDLIRAITTRERTPFRGTARVKTAA